jgi:hypothetical protein
MTSTPQFLTGPDFAQAIDAKKCLKAPLSEYESHSVLPMAHHFATECGAIAGETFFLRAYRDCDGTGLRLRIDGDASDGFYEMRKETPRSRTRPVPARLTLAGCITGRFTST